MSAFVAFSLGNTLQSRLTIFSRRLLSICECVALRFESRVSFLAAAGFEAAPLEGSEEGPDSGKPLDAFLIADEAAMAAARDGKGGSGWAGPTRPCLVALDEEGGVGEVGV